MKNDALDDRISKAARSLRREAPGADKHALVRRLKLDEKPSFLQRLGIAWERHGREWRQPVYGFAFAALLAVTIALGLSVDLNGADAPEIDDIEFSGGSAVVIETHADHTTLIWLSEVDDDQLRQDDENGALPGEEPASDEREVQGI